MICEGCGVALRAGVRACPYCGRTQVRGAPAAEEQFFFNDETLVTNERVVVRGTTHATHHITGVDVWPAGKTRSVLGSLLVAIACAVIAFALVGAIVEAGSKGLRDGMLVVLGGMMCSSVFVAPGVILLLRRKPLYDVAVTTRTGGLVLLTTPDRPYADAVCTAVRQAVASHR